LKSRGGRATATRVAAARFTGRPCGYCAYRTFRGRYETFEGCWLGGASHRKQPRPIGDVLIAGLPVRGEDALVLIRLLERLGASEAAQRISNAIARDEHDITLRLADRDAALRVLAECPDGLLKLRATLHQQLLWRQQEGL
jgi:hypothetical protein